MRTTVLFSVLTLPLLLVACKPPTPTADAPAPTPAAMEKMEKDDAMMHKDDDKMMKEEAMEKEDDKMMKEEAMMEKEDDTAVSTSSYLAFNDGVIGNGEESVLFFKADWCPSCVAKDKTLTGLYPSEDLVPAYVIDYDNSSDLKAKYGVVQQDTFIRIDGEGNVIKMVSFPTESALKSLIARG